MNFKLNKINWGLWIGILIFVLLISLPTGSNFNQLQRNMLAILGLMGIWWMTEALPLGVTALLPLILYPFLGIMTTEEIAPNYMHHLIFLFMGGFIIAISLQKWQLHQRFALFTITIIGSEPKRLVFSFMLVAAILSMWISNTATALMMLPIGLAVINQFKGNKKDLDNNNDTFNMVLLLGIAYGASIGGMATIIGTPPNIVFLGIADKYFPDLLEISFIGWMIWVLPLTLLIFLFTIFFFFVPIFKKKKISNTHDKSYFKNEYNNLGRLSLPQKLVLSIFILTAFLWITRSGFNLGIVNIPGWSTILGLDQKIQDSTIAMGMAILLFIIPSGLNKEPKTLLTWKNLSEIPWDILLLFGGGFAIAEGIKQTGLGTLIGHKLEFIGTYPIFVMIFIIAITATFLTEFTSNTAIANTILPILASLSIQLEVNPLMIMLPATIACSCAFMLPVATPPNAIVFGSRFIPISKMVKIGVVLNIFVAFLSTLYFYVLFAYIL
jgi:sodium-dependent dicarboxylate transporter 2/3/5